MTTDAADPIIPPGDLEELEKECDLEFTRTGGPGGQHRNKASTAVRVTHRPSGIVVVAADSRSQYQNRMAALQRLKEQLEALEAEREAAEKKRRRRQTKPSRAAKERRIREKKEQSEKKKRRKRLRPPTDV